MSSQSLTGSRPAPWTRGHRPEPSSALLPPGGLRFPLPPCLPAAPAGLPPHINYSLSPVAPSPSLCDPGGYRVSEARGRPPRRHPRHLSEVSGPAPEAPRPCRATPTRPSGRQRRPASPTAVSNGLLQSVMSSRLRARRFLYDISSALFM